jgi:hypothetical protein
VSIVTVKGIDPPQSIDVDQWQLYWLPWLKRFADAFPRTRTYTSTLTPSLVAANTTAEQTFTIAGLGTTDIVVVNKPSLDTGIGIAGARVTAVDTLGITFINATGSGITPTSESYRILAIRT